MKCYVAFVCVLICRWCFLSPWLCSFVWRKGVRGGGPRRGVEFTGVRKHGQAHWCNPDESKLQPVSHHFYPLYGPAAGKLSPLWDYYKLWTTNVVFQVPLCWPGGVWAHPKDGEHWRETEREHPDQQRPSGSWKCYRGTGGPQEERLSYTIQRF